MIKPNQIDDKYIKKIIQERRLKMYLNIWVFLFFY